MGFVEERVRQLRSAAAGADRRETEMPLKSTDEDDPKRLVVPPDLGPPREAVA